MAFEKQQNNPANNRTRVSASALGRLSACAASLAKRDEVRAFYRAHDLPKMTDYAETQAGTVIHETLAQVPFASKELGIGEASGSLFRRVKPLFQEAKKKFPSVLTDEDFWLVYGLLKKRDAITTRVLLQWGLQSIEKVEQHLDSERLFSQRHTPRGRHELFSGLPDFVIRAQMKDGSQKSLIIDYKSGWVMSDDGPGNKQMLGLAVLEKENNPAVTEVYTGILTRTHLNAPPAVYVYDEALMSKGGIWLDNKLDEVLHLAEVAEGAMDEEGKLNEDVEGLLYASSTPGDHCAYCEGKAACIALREEAGVVISQRMERAQAIAEEFPFAGEFARFLEAPDDAKRVVISPAIKARLIAGIAQKEGIPVQKLPKMANGEIRKIAIEKLSLPEIEEVFSVDEKGLKEAIKTVQELTQGLSVLDKTRKETEHLAKALLARKQVPGMSLDPGYARLTIRGGESMSPSELFELLAPAVAGLEKEGFLAATARCSAASVRDYLSSFLDCPADKVVGILEERLGAAGNPLEMTPAGVRIKFAEESMEEKGPEHSP